MSLLTDFPRCRVHLDQDGGDWACWAYVKGFGTVLWRLEYPQARCRLEERAYRLAGHLGNMPKMTVQIIGLRKI